MKPNIMNRLKSKHNIAALAIMLTYIALAVAYSMVTPLWEAPDEAGHTAFILHLQLTHTLPVQQLEISGCHRACSAGTIADRMVVCT